MITTVAIIIFIILIVLVVGMFISIFNRLVMLKQNRKKAFANIDVLLKQRADEVPNLVAIVKGAKEYEAEILKDLTQLRSAYLNSSNINDKIEVDHSLSKEFSRVMAVMENYPELKATESFLKLQDRLSQIETMIAHRREFFNESVNLYNTGIERFPDFILARMMKYEREEFFMISEKEREISLKL